MNEPIQPAGPSAEDELWETIDAAVDRLEECWRTDEGPDLAHLVLATDSHIRCPLLAELIKVDLEHHWRRGQQKHVEDYLDRWPELRSHAEIVRDLFEAECLTRTLFADDEPTRQEIDERYAGMSEKIAWDFIEEELESRRFRQSVLHEGEGFGRDERYEIRELLGRGGMGTVYRAYDRRLDREVALKIPLLHPHLKHAVLERFLREAKLSAKIRHANVCPIFDADQASGTYYLTMALIEGQPLSRWMKTHKLSVPETAGIALKLTRALSAVHATGVLHRDVKPANVVIDEKGEPWLMDFGLAGHTIEELSAPPAGEAEKHFPQNGDDAARAGLHRTESRLMQTKSLLGTLPYMAPELFEGKKAGPQSDIYSLGVLLYEMLAGRHPFIDEATEQIQPPSTSVIPTLSGAVILENSQFEAICSKAMARNPADRFASADAMADKIQQLLVDQSHSSSSPPKKRRGSWLLSAVFLPIILVAGIVLYLKTGEGVAQLECNVPDATVSVDEQELPLTAGKAEFILPVGEHRIQISKEGFRPYAGSFSLSWRGTRAELKVNLTGLYIARWIETSERITGGAFNHDESRLYVSACLHPAPSLVQFLDLPSGKLLGNVIGSTGDNDYKSIALSHDDRYVFVTNYYLKTLTRIEVNAPHTKTDLDIGSRWSAMLGIVPNGKILVAGAGMDGRVKDEKNDRLAIVDIEGGRFDLLGTVLLDDEPSCLRPGFSADSRSAFFVTRERKSPSASLYEVALEKPFRVTHNPGFPNSRLEGIAVSAKGGRVFLGDPRNKRVVAVDLKSFQETAVYETGGYAPGPVVLNAAEDLLAVGCPAAKKVYFLDPKDGTLLDEASGLEAGLFDMKFSADGKWLYALHFPSKKGAAVIDLKPLLERCRIVFASNRDGESHQLYLVGADGMNAKRLTYSKGTDFAPRWSPDGRKIAFIADRDGPPKIRLIKRNGDAVRVFEKTDPLDGSRSMLDEVPLAWSPDGEKIAFIANRYQAIRTVAVQTGEVETLLEGEVDGRYAMPLSLCWNAADGSLLVGSQSSDSSEMTAIFWLDPKTKKTKVIYRSDGSTFRLITPVISHDGKRILTARQYFQPASSTPLSILNPEAGNLQMLINNEGALNFSPRWTAQEKAVFSVTEKAKRMHLCFFQLPDGKPVMLTDGDWDDVNPDVWGEVEDGK